MHYVRLHEPRHLRNVFSFSNTWPIGGAGAIVEGFGGGRPLVAELLVLVARWNTSEKSFGLMVSTLPSRSGHSVELGDRSEGIVQLTP
jgi:hypothetical protein